MPFRKGPPGWLPWLAPLIAAAVGGLVGVVWLEGGFWTVLLSAIACGVGLLIIYGLWRRWHRRR